MILIVFEELEEETEIVPPTIDSMAGVDLRQIRGEESFLNGSVIQSQIEPSPVQIPVQIPTRQLKNLRIEEGRPFANRRLRLLGLELSEKQPETPGDGNCFIHAVADQTR